MTVRLGARQIAVLRCHIEYDGTRQAWIPSSDWGARGMQTVWESLLRRGYVQRVPEAQYRLFTSGYAITESGIQAYLAAGGRVVHGNGENFLDAYRERHGYGPGYADNADDNEEET